MLRKLVSNLDITISRRHHPAPSFPPVRSRAIEQNVNIFPPSPASRLRRFIAGLCDLLGRHLPRQADPLPGFLLWQWLRRLARRLDGVAARPPALPPSPGIPSLPHWPAPLPAARAPCRRGWLVELSPDFISQGEALRRLLMDTRIQELMEATPGLHPALCRLLRLLDTDAAAAAPRAAAAAIRPAWPERKARDWPETIGNSCYRAPIFPSRV